MSCLTLALAYKKWLIIPFVFRFAIFFLLWVYNVWVIVHFRSFSLLSLLSRRKSPWKISYWFYFLKHAKNQFRPSKKKIIFMIFLWKKCPDFFGKIILKFWAWVVRSNFRRSNQKIEKKISADQKFFNFDQKIEFIFELRDQIIEKGLGTPRGWG